mgnify:CR=1 FL=1
MIFEQQIKQVLDKGKISGWCWDGDNENEVQVFDSDIALEQLIEFLNQDNNFEQFKQLIDEK